MVLNRGGQIHTGLPGPVSVFSGLSEQLLFLLQQHVLVVFDLVVQLFDQRPYLLHTVLQPVPLPDQDILPLVRRPAPYSDRKSVV